jgi:hypothetical protein
MEMKGRRWPRVIEWVTAKEVQGMTPQEIDEAIGQAGFQRIHLKDSHCIVFMRGASMLYVHADGKWAFYTEIAEGKIPDVWGKDLDSLVPFLTSTTKCRVAGVN